MITWTKPEQLTDIVKAGVKTFKEAQKTKATRVDAIVCQGMSGATVATAIAAQTGIPLVIIRQPEDKHGACFARIDMRQYLGKKNVFIDDHISEGRTFKRCQETILRNFEPGYKFGKITHTYQYNKGWAYADTDKIIPVEDSRRVGDCYNQLCQKGVKVTEPTF